MALTVQSTALILNMASTVAIAMSKLATKFGFLLLSLTDLQDGTELTD